MLSAKSGHKVKAILVQQQIKPHKMNIYACKRTEIPSADNNLFYFCVPLQRILNYEL